MFKSTVVASCLAAASAHAAVQQSTVPFLFSQDQAVRQTSDQFNAGVEPRPKLKPDDWLNAPLTRLDYILMRLDKELDDRAKSLPQVVFRDSFEPEFVGMAPAIEFSVGYSDEKARLVVSARADGLGRPKKPMKDACDTLISAIEQIVPVKEPIGYTWHNNALGQLQRGDGDYNTIIDDLKKRVLIVASVSAAYSENGTRLFFQLGCRHEMGKPTEYYKYSSTL